MNPSPNKKFPKVSLCCRAEVAVSCGDEGTCCYICAECRKSCDAVSDEGLGEKFNNFKGIPATPLNDDAIEEQPKCEDLICVVMRHDAPNCARKKAKCQPSQNEAKEERCRICGDHHLLIPRISEEGLKKCIDNFPKTSSNLPTETRENDLLEKAKELLEEYPSIYEELYEQKDIMGIGLLLTEVRKAQAQKSFEEGKKWQKEKDKEILEKLKIGIVGEKLMKRYATTRNDLLEKAKKEILNS